MHESLVNLSMLADDTFQNRSPGINRSMLDFDPLMYEYDTTSYVVLEYITNFLNIFGIPFIIVIGVIGNTLSIITLSCSYLRHQSSTVYLAFLSTVDTGFLVSLAFVWLQKLHVNIFVRTGWCTFVIFTTYVYSFLSVWTVVSFTFERYVVVYHPLRKNSLCTRRRARIVVSSLVVLAVLLYSFSLWTSGVLEVPFVKKEMCMELPQYFAITRVIININTVVTMVLPSFLIVFFNAAMAIKIVNFMNRRRAGLHVSSSSSSPRLRGTDDPFDPASRNRLPLLAVPGVSSLAGSRVRVCDAANLPARQLTLRKHGGAHLKDNLRHTFQLRTTRSLLLVSSMFVALNLPDHVFRVYVFSVYLVDERSALPRSALLWLQVLKFLYYSNFAANFFLYNACSRSFRCALRRLCWTLKRRAIERFNRSRRIYYGGNRGAL